MTTNDPIETAAQVLHDRRHRAGTGQVCDECRADVQVVADVLGVERLRGIEQRAREYVEAVDRGRQLGVANLGRPILQFQPLRAALGIGPFLGDDDA